MVLSAQCIPSQLCLHSVTQQETPLLMLSIFHLLTGEVWAFFAEFMQTALTKISFTGTMVS